MDRQIDMRKQVYNISLDSPGINFVHLVIFNGSTILDEFQTLTVYVILCIYYTVVQMLVLTLEYVLQAAITFFERDLKLLYRFFRERSWW